MQQRNYARIVRDLEVPKESTACMQNVVNALWNTLSDQDVSWVGFYLLDGEDQMVLGPRRDKPACSPIGLHGACGQALLSRRPLIVRDAAELGDGYIACDPRDKSEVVIPLIDPNGGCRAVLDLDSYSVGAFDETDVNGLTRVLIAAGLTHPQAAVGHGK